jgi:hypothetical protein
MMKVTPSNFNGGNYVFLVSEKLAFTYFFTEAAEKIEY